MKKIITSFISFLILSNFLIHPQSTAIDFTVNDCNSNSRHLFGELDAGKVVVMVMVDPCTSCIGPAKSALNAVNSYANTNPGKVVYYLTDDVGNTSCSSLVAWGNANGIKGVVTISDAVVTQLDYGSKAMPKVVVLSGWGHKVNFVQDDGLNVTNLKNAINAAIISTGLNDPQVSDFKMSVFPNPASESISVQYELMQSGAVDFEIYNVLGTTVQTIHSGYKAAGTQQEKFEDLGGLTGGLYFVRLSVHGHSQLLRFTIVH